MTLTIQDVLETLKNKHSLNTLSQEELDAMVICSKGYILHYAHQHDIQLPHLSYSLSPTLSQYYQNFIHTLHYPDQINPNKNTLESTDEVESNTYSDDFFHNNPIDTKQKSFINNFNNMMELIKETPPPHTTLIEQNANNFIYFITYCQHHEKDIIPTLNYFLSSINHTSLSINELIQSKPNLYHLSTGIIDILIKEGVLDISNYIKSYLSGEYAPNQSYHPFIQEEDKYPIYLSAFSPFTFCQSIIENDIYVPTNYLLSLSSFPTYQPFIKDIIIHQQDLMSNEDWLKLSKDSFLFSFSEDKIVSQDKYLLDLFYSIQSNGLTKEALSHFLDTLPKELQVPTLTEYPTELLEIKKPISYFNEGVLCYIFRNLSYNTACYFFSSSISDYKTKLAISTHNLIKKTFLDLDSMGISSFEDPYFNSFITQSNFTYIKATKLLENYTHHEIITRLATSLGKQKDTDNKLNIIQSFVNKLLPKKEAADYINKYLLLKSLTSTNLYSPSSKITTNEISFSKLVSLINESTPLYDLLNITHNEKVDMMDNISLHYYEPEDIFKHLYRLEDPILYSKLLIYSTRSSPPPYDMILNTKHLAYTLPNASEADTMTLSYVLLRNCTTEDEEKAHLFTLSTNLYLRFLPNIEESDMSQESKDRIINHFININPAYHIFMMRPERYPRDISNINIFQNYLNSTSCKLTNVDFFLKSFISSYLKKHLTEKEHLPLHYVQYLIQNKTTLSNFSNSPHEQSTILLDSLHSQINVETANQLIDNALFYLEQHQNHSIKKEKKKNIFKM